MLRVGLTTVAAIDYNGLARGLPISEASELEVVVLDPYSADGGDDVAVVMARYVSGVSE